MVRELSYYISAEICTYAACFICLVKPVNQKMYNELNSENAKNI